MPKITIDDQTIEVEQGTTVFQAASRLGIEIPHFCYHEKLSVPANCRMCLVEIEGGPPKPQPSCSMQVNEGMIVHTNSEMVKNARKSVMEMLLINHPLDCPICDQGGECDLQDQAFGYGYDRSRYYESKRTVSEKNISPLIKTAMTRCIQCTRCVRFCDEIAGTGEIGLINRGEDTEIITYGNDHITTELSGNLIDVCPVGALNSKPYSFTARPWELTKTDSIDIHDGVGSNIRIDCKNNRIMRILPRLNEDINEQWIDDKTRFSYDGLYKNRLDRFYIKSPKTGKLIEASKNDALSLVAEKLTGAYGKNISALSGNICSLDSIIYLKELMQSLKSPNMDCLTDGSVMDTSTPAGYMFNSSIKGIDEADAVLLIGTNPRKEAAIINARIRKSWLNKKIPIALIGERIDLTYPYEYLGASPSSITELLKGKSKFVKNFKQAEKPMIIIGSGVFQRADGLAIHHLLFNLAENLGVVKPNSNWNGFNVLHNNASRTGALYAGFTPDRSKAGKGFREIIDGTKDGSIKVLYMLGCDEFDARAEIGWQTFVIYQGHHGDKGASRADVILPSCAYTEEDALFMNTEGKIQQAKKAVQPCGEAMENTELIKMIAKHANLPLPYQNKGDLYEKISVDIGSQVKTEWKEFGKPGEIFENEPFKSTVSDFYITNTICKNSKIMHECSDLFTNNSARNMKQKAG